MKAIEWTNYGKPEVLKFREFKKPLPKSNEVLVKIHASTVTAGDTRIRALNVPTGFSILSRLAFGLTKPRNQTFGMDLSGEIESIGKDVTLFKKGDMIFGTTGMKLGANAEYVCLSEKSALVKKPENTTYEEAAAVIFGGMTAIHFLRDKIQIKNGQRVLINGASGAVGTASIQIAKYFGADVTGICSASNIELVKSLGVKHTIDYAKVDVNQSNQKYDVILDTIGNFSLSQSRNILTKEGKLILISANLSTILYSIIQSKIICGVADESKKSLNFLRKLVEERKFRAVIDRTYTLEQTAEAHSYVDTARKKGNVVITMPHLNS